MSPATRPDGLRLGVKLALALAGVAALIAMLLLVWVGPATGEALRTRSASLVDAGANALRGLAADDSRQNREILTSLIDETTAARRRTLIDLPLELYGGDVSAIRSALQEKDAARGAILRNNVAVLTREVERRNAARIDAEARTLVAQQDRLADGIAKDLRTTSLLLAGLVLAISLAGFGVGLHRLVVLPVQRLGMATRAIARGELGVAIDVPRRRDEIGALALDFARMLDELRSSRALIDAKNAELRTWNERLEQEVARQTAHLESTVLELRRAQRRLVHAAKMSSLGTLAGGVAHEFNNLIGGIRGCAREAIAGEPDAERRETLEVIARAAERAGEVTDRLLRFARQRVVPKDEVDLAEVLREALRLIESRARAANVASALHVGVALPLRADASALHQVFLNLFTNAVQAMPRGGQLDVDARRDGDEIVVTVRDTGIGIAPEHHDRVFDPFWTSKDTEAAADSRGTGLGLSVSHGLVEAHGGTIDFVSEPGRGTTFTVRLPARGVPADDAR
ncbi:MAG: HAMP domain-containing protein [Planctomycetes bacterium]|nr:HAMP domain-containing protein [Planctomycetota bacterium]